MRGLQEQVTDYQSDINIEADKNKLQPLLHARRTYIYMFDLISHDCKRSQD